MAPTSEEGAGIGYGERLYSSPPQPSDLEDTWWGRYVGSLGNLTSTARSVLEVDSDYVVDRGIFGVGAPDPAAWPSSRVRRGLVMGSVQSGKTASMLGVAAKALDRGADVVVVLTGTRLSLWRQTFGRLQTQLDVGTASAGKERRRVLAPAPGLIEGTSGSVPLSALYRLQPAQVRRALAGGRPLIIVAMKQTDHLRALGQSLRDSVFPTVDALGRPVHMVVFDDEADDGSVLDARVENSVDPVFGNLKQIPRAISDLWAPRSMSAPANFLATYVGYTATPQANFLQEDQNPLFPQEFVISLRTPFDEGRVEIPSSTYFEPGGLSDYYTGGTAFYERGRTAGLCLPLGSSASEDLADAIRAFLVAGAIRLIRSGDRLGPRAAAEQAFKSRAEAELLCPAPQSMLIHPSASVGDQFDTAVEVLRWAGVETDEGARELIEAGHASLPEALSSVVDQEEEKWAAWVERYRNSAIELQRAFAAPTSAAIPAWAQVKEALQTEIIPGTRVAVVNSDPAADDRPEYEPQQEGDYWRGAPDLSTIFVSGNVMARGLTLEGLTTTLFRRRSDQPLADSQMQMQRWFGYRGSYLELCRLFADSAQLGFFASYHDVDEAMRQTITALMTEDRPAPPPGVLQGRGFLATGKIANLGNQPLCQGSRPLVRLVNSGKREDPNAAVVAGLFSHRPSREVRAGGALRGRMLEEPIPLLEAADLLDLLRFESYAPGVDSWQGTLWARIQSRVEEQGLLPYPGGLYRPPAPPNGHEPDSVRKDCPYSLGAYLRLWEACLSRRVRGLFPTDNPSLPWSTVDLEARRGRQPRFWVGIRYGGQPPVASGPLSELGFQLFAAARSVVGGQLAAPWGSQDPTAGPNGYRGDDFMDYYFRGAPVMVTEFAGHTWRPAGSDGQILFYVNQPAGQPHPSVIAGVCMPIGGPDQFAVSSPRS